MNQIADQISIKPEFAWGARVGYAARGVIYLMIGGLAVMTAFGSGGKTTGTKGALTSLLEQPFGQIMFGLVAIGLFCYSGWRAVQCISDTDNHGTNGKGLAIRAGLLISSITHLLLAIWAFSVLFGSGSSGSSNGASGLIGHTWGRWLLGAAGIAIIGAGIAHLIKGWKAGFEKYMDIPSQHRGWAVPMCRFGLVSRGAVYCLVGFFLVSSVVAAGSADLKNVGEALTWLRDQPFGIWLLGVTAVGLFSFGVYSGLEAMYRRIDR
ncbi:MAG TPA: DUF1206 domain-containing protein [Marinagarivorans sp.]